LHVDNKICDEIYCVMEYLWLMSKFIVWFMIMIYCILMISFMARWMIKIFHKMIDQKLYWSKIIVWFIEDEWLRFSIRWLIKNYCVIYWRWMIEIFHKMTNHDLLSDSLKKMNDWDLLWDSLKMNDQDLLCDLLKMNDQDLLYDLLKMND